MTSEQSVAASLTSADAPTRLSGKILRRERWWRRLDQRAAALLFAAELVLLIMVWQIATGVLGLVNPVFLPDPGRIFHGFFDLAAGNELLGNLAVSGISWGTGYVLAVIVGVVLGLIVGGSLPAHRLASPILWTIYATPWLAYRPLSVAWFGFGLPPIIFLIFIAAVFPVLLNTAAGAGTTDESLLRASKVFGAGRFATYRMVVLPATLPYILAGMRQSAVLATIALLVAEMTGSSVGIGALIALKTQTYRTDEAFVAIIISLVWTVGMSQLIGYLGHRLAPWQGDARS